MNDVQYVSNQGVKLWTNSSYKGSKSSQEHTYMLLASGGPGFEYYLEPITNMVNDLVHVISFEQRGCGISDSEPPYDIQTTIDDLEAIRKHYKITNWIIAGHSWGATVALAYALAYPLNVQAIIYIAGNGVQHDIDWHAKFHYNKKNYPDPLPDMKYQFQQEVNSIGNQSWWDQIKDPSIWKKLSQLNVQSLIIQAERDVRPNWPAQQLAKLLPNAIYIEIKDAVHCIWLTHADELKKELRGFINTII